MAESVENLLALLRKKGYTPKGTAFTLRLLASELKVNSKRRAELLAAAQVICPGSTD
jgi:hypothetical protein